MAAVPAITAAPANNSGVLRVFMYVAGAYVVLALVAAYRWVCVAKEEGLVNPSTDGLGTVVGQALLALQDPGWVLKTAFEGPDRMAIRTGAMQLKRVQAATTDLSSKVQELNPFKGFG